MNPKPWRTWRGCQRRPKWRARPKALTRREWRQIQTAKANRYLDEIVTMFSKEWTT